MMSLKSIGRLFLAAALCLALFSPPLAAADDRIQKPAIVLAAFGTTETEALTSILNVKKRVQAAFPGYEVHLAFTSNIIRDIWRQRADDKAFRRKNAGIPEEIYRIANPLTVLAGLQERGPRVILAQSLHVTNGEEYGDLKSAVSQLANIKTLKRRLHPFPWIGLGEPALGEGRAKDIERAAQALAPLVNEARQKNMALVLMGHGNEHMAQPAYRKLEKELRKVYGPDNYIGLVEGQPDLADILAAMNKKERRPAGVLLAPLMVVAGDHARNDMAGGEEDSWNTAFAQAGYQVAAHLKGLGSNDAWADIYVEHLKALEGEVLKKKAAEGEL
ncbi:MAG: sirohydrochlorin cobaltochelatase [Candidatus Adiutrix sp.]|jgi:sirohydrochlorin cobaltochelatase|nr:sirohydrochlorin cobaltochelatase [Candidatus Adiutrix sp.]